jgi:hypothetical protein
MQEVYRQLPTIDTVVAYAFYAVVIVLILKTAYTMIIDTIKGE